LAKPQNETAGDESQENPEDYEKVWIDSQNQKKKSIQNDHEKESGA